MPEPRYNHLKTATNQGVLVLTITDPLLLDEEVVDGLHRDLVAAMEHYQPRKVVLNFQNVKYLASVVFRPVISLHRRVQELKGQLLLCGLSNMVAEVFHITGLVSNDPGGAAPLAAEANLAAAVARLNQPEPNPTA
jgi:anti-anti-sigma factor